MNALTNWPRNRLLLALPSADLTRLMPALERVSCEREQVLIDVDSPLDHVFFPDSGVVSAVAVYTDGRVIEMATIGREGCTGASRHRCRKLLLPASGPDSGGRSKDGQRGV